MSTPLTVSYKEMGEGVRIKGMERIPRCILVGSKFCLRFAQWR